MLTYRTLVLGDFWDQSDSPCRPGEEFRSEKARRLNDWWWRGHDGRIPSKSSFDILDHFDAAPEIFLVEVLEDGSFVTRIIGEKARVCVEPGRLGTVIRHDDDRPFIRTLHKHYSLVAQEKIPFKCACMATYISAKGFVFEGLDCPLSLDGTRVTHIIGILTLQQTQPGCLPYAGG
jgi:hypothetical protein